MIRGALGRCSYDSNSTEYCVLVTEQASSSLQHFPLNGSPLRPGDLTEGGTRVTWRAAMEPVRR